MICVNPTPIIAQDLLQDPIVIAIYMQILYQILNKIGQNIYVNPKPFITNDLIF